MTVSEFFIVSSLSVLAGAAIGYYTAMRDARRRLRQMERALNDCLKRSAIASIIRRS